MPEHDANLIVFRSVIEQIGQRDVHGQRHCVSLCRPIQLDPQDASRTFRNNVTHRPPPMVAFSDCRTCGIAPLARKSLIAFASKPSSARTSSLCSPIFGARLAGTLLTPCT